MKNICVFCSSSDAVDEAYFNSARQLGHWIGKQKRTLIFGGANVGLMGCIADEVMNQGGRVIGVIPELIEEKKIAYIKADKLIVTKDMGERKAKMESLADVFIVLPGGFGTLDEVLELITLKQLGLHQKPIILLNTEGFYNFLISQIEHAIEKKFIKEEFKQLFFVAGNTNEINQYISKYNPSGAHINKWYKSLRYPGKDLNQVI